MREAAVILCFVLMVSAHPLFLAQWCTTLASSLFLDILVTSHTHTHTHTQWTKAHCSVQGRILFNILLHTWYHNSLHIYTDGSRLSPPPSVGIAIYTPLHSIATAWRLPASASILMAELFAVSGPQVCHPPPTLCSIILLSDSLTSLQLTVNITALEHTTPFSPFTFSNCPLLAFQSTFSGSPHVGFMGNTVVDRAAAEAHSHTFPIHLLTD